MMPTIRSNLTKEGFLLLSVELDIIFGVKGKLHAKKIPAQHYASYQPINHLVAVKGAWAKKDKLFNIMVSYKTPAVAALK
jgi:hypothetical protein